MDNVFGRSKAKAALAKAQSVNALLPVDAEARFLALEAIDHWHTNLTQLDKVKGFSNFTFFGDGTGLSIATKTANYTLNTQDTLLLVNASTGAITITLPNPTLCYDNVNLASIIFAISKIDTSHNIVTIAPYASETINGSGTITLAHPKQSVRLSTDGTNWHIESSHNLLHGIAQTYKSNSIITSDTTVANTIAETQIFSTTLDSNELEAANMMEFVIDGIYSTVNSSDTFTVRIKKNGTLIDSFTSVPKNVSNTPVSLHYKMTVRTSGATGTFTSISNFSAPNDSLFGSAVSDGSIDTTIANTFTVTMQWDAASVSNSGTVKQGICKING